MEFRKLNQNNYEEINMHQYLTAIGFGNIKSKKEWNKILERVENDFNQYVIVSEKDDVNYCEFRKEFAEGIGISLAGTIDDEDYFEREFYYPYFAGSGITTYAEIVAEKRIDRESYIGVCEDAKLGINILFHVQNADDYIKNIDKVNYLEKIPTITLSGLCNEGIILLPVMKDKKQEQKQKEQINNRMELLIAAKNGDPAAIQGLTLDDIDTYSKVSRRLITEDVYTIVDTYMMPYGAECDLYSILGTIREVRKTCNEYTKEEIYIMSLEVNDLLFDICVPVKNTMGEPEEGRRFKGNIWLQGYINF